MEEETRSQPAADLDVVEDTAASVHEENDTDAPSEPQADETGQSEHVTDASLMSDIMNSLGEPSGGLDEDHDEADESADKSTLSNDNDFEADQDQSYLDESVVEEEGEDVHDETESQTEEESVLPSIESDGDGQEEDDYEDEERDDSILDDSNLQDDRSSHRGGSSRRTSGRTEALIQQAARDIVAALGTPREEKQEYQEEPEQDSVLSDHTDIAEQHHERSCLSVTENQEEEQTQDQEMPSTTEEGADSSSHHGTDEDVFSENSTRSSMGSYDGGSESGKNMTIVDGVSIATRSPRMSDVSQYDYKGEDFVPTIRGNPRPPFRSPSDVRAMQMSSPDPSVFGSVIGSSRSSKRPFPTVSRLGSPSNSAQYSPKNRTPSRFKAKEAPLVLLHVTLLPLRWMWGDIINTFDAEDMSEQAKTLREAWRMLQDRMGDTVCERGILLGHPQNDYEILEERLLEALDLPVRRRARILECGHYLGPATETAVVDDSESEDEFDVTQRPSPRHWCKTCNNEIAYDALYPGKIFRVKVYASNGLMKAGAWDACWKEMERVDVEIEPILEPGVSEELERLLTAQQEREAASHQQIELATNVAQQIEEQIDQQMDCSFEQQPDLLHAQLEIAPPMPETPMGDLPSAEERRFLQEERLREIYGHTPSPEMSQEPETAYQPHPDSYVTPPSQRSPSEEAYERREARRQALQSASFGDLLVQSARVLMQDTRNIFIIGLSLLVLLMALRSPQNAHTNAVVFDNKSVPEVQEAPIVSEILGVQEEPSVLEEVPSALETVMSFEASVESIDTLPAIVSQSMEVEVETSSIAEPRATPMALPAPEPQELEPAVVAPVSQKVLTQKTTVKVVETVTETATLRIETVTETETMRVKATVTVTDAPKSTATSSDWSMDLELYGAESSEANVIVDESMLIEAH
ncbi:hypothetical protein G7054_g4025 [Neopestalotiopsis clavispora]|nr:hypothetical protein G7054_g4025 [Neopestalotiopsis clavispora]